MQQPPNPFAAVLAQASANGRTLSGERRDRTREAAPRAVLAREARQRASLAERNAFAATMHANADYPVNGFRAVYKPEQS